MKGKWNLFAVNGMYWVTTAVFQPFIGAYYTSIGMSESQVGILAAVIPVSSLLIQPVWAYISDRTGKRRTVIMLLCIGCAGSILLFSRAGTFVQCLAGILLYASFFSALLPLSDALVVRAAKLAHADFSYIRMCGTITYAVTVILIGRLVKDHYSVIFKISCASFLFFLLCCTTLKDEPGRISEPAREKAGGAKEQIRRKQELFDSRQIIAVLLFVFAMHVGLNYHGTFFSVYLISLGFDNGTIGIMNCISALSEVPVLLLMSRIQKRFSIMQLLPMTILLCALRLLLVSGGNIYLMTFAQLLQGPTYMICYFSCVMYISEHVLAGRISQGQSLLALVQSGIGCIFGSLAGGMLAENFGIRAGFRVVSVMILALGAAAMWLDRYLQKQNKKGGTVDGSISV